MMSALRRMSRASVSYAPLKSPRDTVVSYMSTPYFRRMPVISRRCFPIRVPARLLPASYARFKSSISSGLISPRSVSRDSYRLALERLSLFCVRSERITLLIVIILSFVYCADPVSHAYRHRHGCPAKPVCLHLTVLFSHLVCQLSHILRQLFHGLAHGSILHLLRCDKTTVT